MKAEIPPRKTSTAAPNTHLGSSQTLNIKPLLPGTRNRQLAPNIKPLLLPGIKLPRGIKNLPLRRLFQSLQHRPPRRTQLVLRPARRPVMFRKSSDPPSRFRPVSISVIPAVKTPSLT
uniref:Uncharacterized protein n=1 Tax=Cacopsylla melanoneura TaxID=428564 RepID=A0A8D8L893_9HEMI